LLDAALGNESAHKGLFTELAVLYAKYRPEKLMEHLKVSWGRMNIAKVIVVCKAACHWPELVFLYQHYDENDNAAITMMEHSTEAWEHVNFKDVIIRVSNLDIYYRAIEFYLSEQPQLLTDLLSTVSSKVDNSRVVGILRKHNNLSLIKKYLIKVQSQNMSAVNEALNDLYIDEEDTEALRRSINDFPSFDQTSLAQP
jgi:clathrin heavy chain